MYQISVPVMLNPRFEKDFDLFMQMFRQAKVHRVFFCSVMCTATRAEKDAQLRLIREYVPKVEAAGMEAGVWISSLGHGAPLLHEDGSAGLPYPGITAMEDLDGNEKSYSYCPLNPAFTELFGGWLQEIARAGARIIMLDDDYRMSLRGGKQLCACALHREKLEQELGEPVSLEMLRQGLADPMPNRVRSAWLRVQGDSLLQLAYRLREAVDQVNPQVRLGHCSMLSTWDIDGVDSMTLSRAFAGNTQPFLRYIGAPYWGALHHFYHLRLAYICEYERMQQHWCEGSGIETFCEGDTYPRPRCTVPAAYLEGFDTAMQVAGTCDGTLKYMFDYNASPRYDTGYWQTHCRNLPLYEALQARFGGMQSIGVSIFQPMKTLEFSHDPGTNWKDRCLPAALRFACDCTLPIRYDSGEEATILFGDAAEQAGDEQLARGAILDVTAAQILTRRGFDVGLRAVGEPIAAQMEHFPEWDEDVSLSGGDWLCVTPDGKAQVLSQLSRGSRRAPAAYYYENASGQRFLVYAFRAQTAFERGEMEHGIFRSSCRARQVQEILPRLTGKTPVVMCGYAPDLYVQAKAAGNRISVALWNFCEDAVYGQQVTFASPVRNVEWVTGTGTADGKTVCPDRIEPFGMAVFTVEL